MSNVLGRPILGALTGILFASAACSGAGQDASSDDAPGDNEPSGVDPDCAASCAPEESSDSDKPDCESCGLEVPELAEDELFAAVGNTGQIGFELHPSPAATLGKKSLVSFVIPFPRDVLADPSNVIIADGTGKELPAHVEELGRWRSPASPGEDRGIRSVLIWADVEFPEDSSPLTMYVRYGTPRQLELGEQGAARSTWSNVVDQDFSMAIAEPAAYAVPPTGWLSACLVMGRTPSIGQTNWEWHDAFLLGGGETAVNNVPPPGNTEPIDYEGQAAPWLFDRAATFYGNYVRTGDVKWFRRAHRAAEFYRQHVNTGGYFDLKSWDDLKYSYGQSLAVDYFLTGNDENLDAIDRVASAGETWTESYTASTNFWTERHHTYALYAALSAFEVTGAKSHGDRAKAIIDATLQHIQNPPAGYAADGCLPHSMESHEGAASSDAVCSPWMTALLADAVWRYYLVSEDDSALEILSSFADYVATYGTYTETVLGVDDMIVPWYLSSSTLEFSDSGVWGDMEHNCDVAGLVARGAYATSRLGRDPSHLEGTLQGLLKGCEAVLDHWHRPEGVSVGKAEWRLTPPRKYSWWFKTGAEMPWFMSRLGL